MTKLRPHITEKTVGLAQKGIYTLEVDYNATKGQIAQLVYENFGFKPVSVNMIKQKYLDSTRLRKQYLDRGMKKAIIKLQKDQKIPGFEIADQTEEKKDKKEAKKVTKEEVKK